MPLKLVEVEVDMTLILIILTYCHNVVGKKGGNTGCCMWKLSGDLVLLEVDIVKIYIVRLVEVDLNPLPYTTPLASTCLPLSSALS
jgi:hypothetical protein